MGGLRSVKSDAQNPTFIRTHERPRVYVRLLAVLACVAQPWLPPEPALQQLNGLAPASCVAIDLVADPHPLGLNVFCALRGSQIAVYRDRRLDGRSSSPAQTGSQDPRPNRSIEEVSEALRPTAKAVMTGPDGGLTWNMGARLRVSIDQPAAED